MEVKDLYDIARKQNIEVLQYPLEKNGSVSIMLDDGSCYIGMDASVRDDSAQERVHLGHELGHCVTGSFYNIHATLDNRQKHENKADKWAIRHLIPVEALEDAVSDGYTEIWELAEKFGVTVEFMQKAVCYYVHGNLATNLYF